MSAVEPNWYGDRFMQMLERVIEIPAEYPSPRASQSLVYTSQSSVVPSETSPKSK